MTRENKLKKLQELWEQPKEYKFNAEEIKLIGEFNPATKYKAYYAFYRKPSAYNAYIVFIIDQIPHSPRRSGIMNNWEMISERPLAKEEYLEMLGNYGCDIKRFKVWYYQTVDALIHEDRKYGVETPEKFVQECRKRGYSGTYQPKIEFDTETV